MTTEIFDIFKIITLKHEKFSQCDLVLIRQIKKKCSPIQSWSVQNCLQSWSTPIQSCPCSSLLLICHFGSFRNSVWVKTSGNPAAVCYIMHRADQKPVVLSVGSYYSTTWLL